MKTLPPNAQLRDYTEFDHDDNPPLKGELTTMFGQLAMCINPCAGYGATEKTLWAVVGEHMRFTTRDGTKHSEKCWAEQLIHFYWMLL